MSETGKRHVTAAEALGQAEDDAGRYAVVLRHGTLEAGLYAPRGADPQQPHTRDEVYVVQTGEGWFVNGDTRRRFGPGDFLFVPAGVEHRFEEFSEDLAVWVLFYGPEGGEAPTERPASRRSTREECRGHPPASTHRPPRSGG